MLACPQEHKQYWLDTDDEMLAALPDHIRARFDAFLSARAGVSPLYVNIYKSLLPSGVPGTVATSVLSSIRHDSFLRDEHLFLSDQCLAI
jgi:hypothetical protein